MECYDCGNWNLDRLVPVWGSGGAELPLCRACYQLRYGNVRGVCAAAGCKASLADKRRGARYCSDACKMRAYRRRTKRPEARSRLGGLSTTRTTC